LAKRTFEQWVQGIFDHPVTEPAWYWEVDADTCVEDDETNVSYLAQLFTTSDQVLRRFDDAQVGQGLNMIVSVACSDHALSMVSGHAPWPARQTAIRSIYNLYAKCLNERCVEGLCHLGEVDSHLNGVCYMWWDLFPAWSGPEDEHASAESSECIGVMERCLSLTNQACLEGALHGLGHWESLFPDRVKATVDQFLKKRTDLRPELVEYARRARDGAVQ
jgi:hypothetical protein